MHQTQTNIISVLLVFYLLIASGCTENLMAKQMREFIKENRMAQHVIGFLTLLVLISMIGGITDIKNALIYTLIGYIWFLFSTKLDVQWNMIILLLLSLGYMYENMINQKENEIINDPILSDAHKKEIISNNENKKIWVIGILFIVTIVGTLAYSYKKHNQYGGEYDFGTFILG